MKRKNDEVKDEKETVEIEVFDDSPVVESEVCTRRTQRRSSSKDCPRCGRPI